MRPKKIRLVKCEPGEKCFKPICKPLNELKSVNLTLDEYEAIRLSDLEALNQKQVAKKMKVHRSTISRILDSAHKKIADALVNIKSIKISGGSCKITRR